MIDTDPYFRRKPINVRDEDGVFTCETVPWRNVDEFERCCELLDAYQKKTKHPGFWTTGPGSLSRGRWRSSWRRAAGSSGATVIRWRKLAPGSEGTFRDRIFPV